jgi:hypothetical protein
VILTHTNYALISTGCGSTYNSDRSFHNASTPLHSLGYNSTYTAGVGPPFEAAKWFQYHLAALAVEPSQRVCTED